MSLRIGSPTGFEITGPLRSADDPPVLVAHDPCGGLSLRARLPIVLITPGLCRCRTVPREPIVRNVNEQRLRKYSRDRRPKSVGVELRDGVGDHVGLKMPSLPP